MMSQFEQRLIDYLNNEFPDYCSNIHSEQLVNLVKTGIKRAQSYGIISEQDICLYIDIMILYGRDFDHDPNYQMSTTILNTENMAPRKRLERLITYLGDQSHIHEEDDMLRN